MQPRDDLYSMAGGIFGKEFNGLLELVRGQDNQQKDRVLLLKFL